MEIEYNNDDKISEINLKSLHVILRYDSAIFNYDGIEYQNCGFLKKYIDDVLERDIVAAFCETFFHNAIVVKCLYDLDEIYFGHTELDMKKSEQQIFRVICDKLKFTFETEKYDANFYDLDIYGRQKMAEFAFTSIPDTDFVIPNSDSIEWLNKYRKLVLGINEITYYRAVPERKTNERVLKTINIPNGVNNHQKGVLYEQDVKRFLKQHYDIVYLWDEFKHHVPHEQCTGDIGIDIVCFDRDGRMIGVQCKSWTCQTLNLTSVSTFVCAGNMRYNVGGTDKTFDRLVLTCLPETRISNNLDKFLKNCGNRVEVVRLASGNY